MSLLVVALSTCLSRSPPLTSSHSLYSLYIHKQLLELILPVCFVSILVAIKNSVQSTSSFASQVVPPFYPSVSYIPLTFADYVTAMQATRVCVQRETRGRYGDFNITGISSQGYNWQVPTVKCDSRKCTQDGQDATPFCEYSILGVVVGEESSSAARAVDFYRYVYETYPALQTDMPFDYDFVRLFDNETAVNDYVTSGNYGTTGYPKLAMAVVWHGDDPSNYTYSLRQNATNFNSPELESRPGAVTTPDTSVLFSPFAKSDTVCAPSGGAPNQGPLDASCTGLYIYNGVMTFQRLVGDYILDRTGAKSSRYFVSQAGMQVVQFPTPQYEKNGFYASTALYGPLLVTLGLLYPVAAMISYIVREKELRQKELMKMMSVAEADIGWSWFLTFLTLSLLSAFATTGASVALYENSAPVYLLVFWVFTFLAVVVFAMLMASFTAKTTRAVLIGLLIFFVGVFLTLAVDVETSSRSIVMLISLHPVAAFSFGLQIIGQLEDLSVGVTASTAGLVTSASGYTFNDALGSLFIDSFLWGVVTFYLNRVIRPDYGQALPLWFPFSLSYWCPGRARAHQEDEGIPDEPEGIPLEPVGAALQRQKEEGKTIEIRGLRKTFGETTAVADLTFSMYSGQITALLGHNGKYSCRQCVSFPLVLCSLIFRSGAGKTTTINCLTGAMAPDSGFATIFGKDTRTQMPQIRQNIGICLQHDCLFPKLTVREHVQFFSRIKGLYEEMSKEEAEKAVDRAIIDVALSEKSSTMSKNLSGGMKRKLSVAIAFCGGSQVVLLDEPTR